MMEVYENAALGIDPHDTAKVIPPVDMVNHPPHYKQRRIECIEATRGMGFSLGNCVKYVYRAPFKGHIMEDLEKARFYMKDHITHWGQPLGQSSKLACRRLAADTSGYEKIFFLAVVDGCYGVALEAIEGLIGDAAEQD
jgi:Protein of unknwon function (DUF3310)